MLIVKLKGGRVMNMRWNPGEEEDDFGDEEDSFDEE